MPSLTLTVLAATVVVTLVILAGLWLQMAAGRDPALGSPPAEPAAAPKRIVTTTVVRRVVPGADGNPGGGASTSSSTTTPAPAPSPAPAPVQTATS